MRKPVLPYESRHEKPCFLHMPNQRQYVFSHFLNLKLKPLIILCGCTARFVSDQVRKPEDRFSHYAAHIRTTKMQIILHILISITKMLNEPRYGKSAFCICENKDADQRLCFRYTDTTIPLLSKSENFQPLAIFCGCTAWFVWNLVGNPEDRFSHNEAHMQLKIQGLSLAWSETAKTSFLVTCHIM